jgi:uncharacterized protein (UPF0332 family)
MGVDDLLRSGRVRRESVSPAEIRQALALADRDLRVARKLLADEVDWGFAVAYNAVLQAARAFMFAQGYRPASAEGHKNVFAFLGGTLGEEHADLVTYFDRMRNKRNQAVYGMAGRIAETEARNLLTKATEFVRLVKRLVKAEPKRRHT